VGFASEVLDQSVQLPSRPADIVSWLQGVPCLWDQPFARETGMPGTSATVIRVILTDHFAIGRCLGVQY
jgi:hypothetical protein